jgi:hypothetical protein
MPGRGHEPASLVGSLVLELLADSPDGRVIGAFSTALALEIRALVVTLTPTHTGLPLGISLPSMALSEGRGWIGQIVRVSASQLVIDGAEFSVALHGVPVWDGRAALARLTPSAQEVRQALTILGAWMEGGARRAFPASTAEPGLRHGIPNHTADGVFATALQAAMSDARRGLLLGDEKLLAGATERLLGAGPGLTPSGDDILCGMLLTLHTGRAAWPHTAMSLARLTSIIRSLATSHTNLFGRSALHAACLGHAGELVCNALGALLSGSPDTPSWLEQLSGLGATSGIDTLHGIHTGLQVMAAYRH